MSGGWPTEVSYPVVAVPDLHGQRPALARLLGRLGALPEWPDASVVFLGDFVDRGPDVRGAIDLVLSLADASPPRAVAAVMGNHDLAVVRATGLDGRPPSPYWVEGYRDRYDHAETFRSYLGRDPDHADWPAELAALRDAMPAPHRDALATLPWVVEAPGHVFLHNGLSPELEATAAEQLDLLRRRTWGAMIRPKPGTKTAAHWQTEYPVWLGADRRLSARPLAAPDGRVQVTGHVHVLTPEVDPVRIRLDTGGGHLDLLTACLLRAPTSPPEFVSSG